MAGGVAGRGRGAIEVLVGLGGERGVLGDGHGCGRGEAVVGLAADDGGGGHTRVGGNFEAGVFEGAAGVVRGAGGRDGESCRWRVDGFVSTVAAAVGVGGGACGS